MKYQLLLILIVLCISCNTETENKQNRIEEDLSGLSKPERLEKLYEKTINATNREDSIWYEQKFFNEFPDDFETLNGIYGHCDYPCDTLAILYRVQDKHFELLFSITSINDTVYAKKLISICKDGNGFVDMGFQDHTAKLLIEKMPLYTYLLNEAGKDVSEGFWYYIHDGPHPENNFIYGPYHKDLLKLQQVDTIQYNIMMEQYERALANSEPHGH